MILVNRISTGKPKRKRSRPKEGYRELPYGGKAVPEVGLNGLSRANGKQGGMRKFVLQRNIYAGTKKRECLRVSMGDGAPARYIRPCIEEYFVFLYIST